ncbi:MAG: hypothetical protein D6681_14535 [Calditrichaeota bacterium]|nr:MAG: hypothetical protein D6681_14535 [Calditrichota bacterium]
MSLQQASPANDTYGITEVGLKRTTCYGKCPAYQVTIHSDGTFEYIGEANVERLGEHTGRVNRWAFQQLCRFIKESDFMNLEDAYAAPAMDLPTVYTTVVMNGTQKRISNYGNAGPAKLWAIEQLIDKLLLEAQWDSPGENQ